MSPHNGVLEKLRDLGCMQKQDLGILTTKFRFDYPFFCSLCSLLSVSSLSLYLFLFLCISVSQSLSPSLFIAALFFVFLQSLLTGDLHDKLGPKVAAKARASMELMEQLRATNTHKS